MYSILHESAKIQPKATEHIMEIVHKNLRQPTIQKSIEIEFISSIHYFEFDDTFVDRPESHDTWELVYIDRGKCDVISDGDVIHLKQGEMFFHKPGEVHLLKVNKGVFAPGKDADIVVFDEDIAVKQVFLAGNKI